MIEWASDYLLINTQTMRKMHEWMSEQANKWEKRLESMSESVYLLINTRNKCMCTKSCLEKHSVKGQISHERNAPKLQRSISARPRITNFTVRLINTNWKDSFLLTRYPWTHSQDSKKRKVQRKREKAGGKKGETEKGIISIFPFCLHSRPSRRFLQTFFVYVYLRKNNFRVSVIVTKRVLGWSDGGWDTLA